MTDTAEKILKQMYDEYLRTGVDDWMSISTPIGNQLEAMGFAKPNVQGDFKITKLGIKYMSEK